MFVQYPWIDGTDKAMLAMWGYWGSPTNCHIPNRFHSLFDVPTARMLMMTIQPIMLGMMLYMTPSVVLVVLLLCRQEFDQVSGEPQEAY
jgi:hypothetical protein